MKSSGILSQTGLCRVLAVAASLGLATGPLLAGGLKLAGEQTDPKPADTGAVAESEAATDATVQTDTEPKNAHNEVPWLGVSTTEASEALSSQLDLGAGVGLVITYVVPESPAAKAGLRKNDVLTRFDDQTLVHPAQLRKLVRVHHDGSVVKLDLYRAGKPETASVTLGKTHARAAQWEEGERALGGSLKDLQKQLRDLHIDDAVRDEMRVLRESLGNIKIDQKEVQEDIRRGMDQARAAIRDALGNMTNADSALNPGRKVLESLAHAGVVVDDKADVVVRRVDKNAKTMIRSDESGTIVLFSNPSLHLTAHDKDGKLLFDGPIETRDERAKVPKDLWERVGPLVDQMRLDPESSEKEKQ